MICIVRVAVVLRTGVWSQASCVCILAPPAAGCVTLGKSLHLSGPQLHLESGDKKVISQNYVVGLVR